MIELYHGSNIEIDKIDLKKGRLGKDFGRGFYLSEDKTQALKMAQTAVDREETGTPTITTFLFDESLLHTPNTLNVKVFKEYSKEWAQFVFMNRSNKTETQAHDFDVVYGPIANDKVGVQIRRFMMKYIDIEQLVKELEFVHPTFQYFFGTEKALSYLTKK